MSLSQTTQVIAKHKSCPGSSENAPICGDSLPHTFHELSLEESSCSGISLMLKKWCLAIGLLLTFHASAVELRTTIWPPYQVMLRGELSGVSMSTVRCVFSDMGEPYSVSVMPWGRAIADLKNGEADGLFSSLPTKELADSAVMSAPFALEKWYWYFAPGIDSSIDGFPRGLRTGAVRASNQERWLEKNGMPVTETVNEGKQLLRLVAAGRLDAFVADERYFKELLNEVDASELERLSRLQRRFIRYMPLGVYFGKHFLAEHPDFMSEFNALIGKCADSSINLSGIEREQVEAIFDERIRPLLKHSRIVTALDAQSRVNETVTDEDIARRDRQWRAEVGQAVQPMISGELGRDISAFLQVVQEASKGLFTEIYLVDRSGLNAGQSAVTTDYYQGDEAPFQQTLGAAVSDLYIGPIEYDASSGYFQVKVSSVVMNPDGKLVGMITVGVDVEKALLKSQ